MVTIPVECLVSACLGAVVCGIVGGIKSTGGPTRSVTAAMFWSAYGALAFGLCAYAGLIWTAGKVAYSL
jgi:hypothetical protein